MKISNLTKDQLVRLRFSQAVLRVKHRRHDLEPFIAEGHRARIARDTKHDPIVNWCNLEVALKQASKGPDTEGALEAHLAHVESVLHVWYRVPPELQSQVILAAQELAIIANENPDDTLMASLSLVQGARSSGDALSEQYTANKKRGEDRRQANSERDLTRLRKKLDDELLRA